MSETEKECLRDRERENSLQFAPSLVVTQHNRCSFCLFVHTTHVYVCNTLVYIITLHHTESSENLRVVVMLEHAAFSPKLMNENCTATARVCVFAKNRTDREKIITINSTIPPSKIEIVPPQRPPLSSSSTFSPIYILSTMHMWIVLGAIYELVCSVLFGHFLFSIARASLSPAYLLFWRRCTTNISNL